MNTRIFGATVSAALLFSAAQAMSATVVIDSFDTNQYVTDVPVEIGGDRSTVTSADADIIGETRTLIAENTFSDGTATSATTLSVSSGYLAFSNDDGAKGRGTLRYDGGGAGLGNLAIGEDPFFFFDVLRFDNGGNVDITVNGEDASGNTITYSENISSGDFSPNLYFSQFTGSEEFDFTNVAVLDFIVDTTNTEISVDGALDTITLNATDVAPIPLPASALLLLGGMGGIGGLSALRRRRKA